MSVTIYDLENHFQDNFLFENLHNRSVCRESAGTREGVENVCFPASTLPFLTFLQAPAARIEGIRAGCSVEHTAS
jgi:hypothetical protein